MTRNKLILLICAGLVLVNVGLAWLYTETSNTEIAYVPDHGQSVRGSMDLTLAHDNTEKIPQMNRAHEKEKLNGIISVPEPTKPEPIKSDNITLAMTNSTGNSSAGMDNKDKNPLSENTSNLVKPDLMPVQLPVSLPDDGTNATATSTNATASSASSLTQSKANTTVSDTSISSNSTGNSTGKTSSQNTTSQNATSSTNMVPTVVKPEEVRNLVQGSVNQNVTNPPKGLPEPDPIIEMLKNPGNSTLTSNTTTKTPEKTSTTQETKGTITASKVSVSEKQIVFRLEGNQPLKGRTTYLTNPTRVLLDIEGLWNVKQPVMPTNTYASALRMGFQEKAVRFVFDVNTDKFERYLNQIAPNIIELTITFP